MIRKMVQKLEEFKGTETYESAHKTGIDKLIEKFGEDKKEEIKNLYSQKRTGFEKDATIFDHLPTLVYIEVKEDLKQKNETLV